MHLDNYEISPRLHMTLRATFCKTLAYRTKCKMQSLAAWLTTYWTPYVSNCRVLRAEIFLAAGRKKWGLLELTHPFGRWNLPRK